MKENIFEIFGMIVFIFIIVQFCTWLIGGAFCQQGYYVSWLSACLLSTLCIIQLIINYTSNE